MLHHRIQTDLKGVDAGVQASTPCTSVSTKSCADCRAFCEYDRMQEVAGCSRLHAGGCNLHAGFMQASCSLHTIVCRRLQVAASCMQDVAGCMQAACSLHAGCMQPACISSVALALLTNFLNAKILGAMTTSAGKAFQTGTTLDEKKFGSIAFNNWYR